MGDGWKRAVAAAKATRTPKPTEAQLRGQLTVAIQERDRCAMLIGERLGMIAKTREQERIIARLEKRLDDLAAK